MKAQVRAGRLVLDEPTDLPEGTIVDLHIVDEGDDLTAKERAALHDALDEAWKSTQAGHVLPSSALLDATS
ncbi:MAG: hypothetical protein AAGF11_09440 [Myxococcota bacterium]